MIDEPVDDDAWQAEAEAEAESEQPAAHGSSSAAAAQTEHDSALPAPLASASRAAATTAAQMIAERVSEPEEEGDDLDGAGDEEVAAASYGAEAEPDVGDDGDVDEAEARSMLQEIDSLTSQLGNYSTD